MISIRKTSLLTAVIGVLTLAGASQAQVTVNSGVTLLGSAPASVLENTLESDDNIFLFQEQSNLLLGSAVNVNINAPGAYFTGGSLTGGSIAAGTLVDTFFFHSDPLDTNNGGLNDVRYTGSVTFDEDILGIIIANNLLNNTDGALGSGSTTYTPNPSRGLELNGLDANNQPVQDGVTWSGKTLTLNHFTHGAVDQVRVITKSRIPEPGTIALLGLGLTGALIALRRRVA